nr:type II R-M system restriction endonuclease domain protein [Helicobacter pylori Hp H-23]
MSIVADCILEFTQYNIEKSFSIRDIWDSPYTNENVKPCPVSSMSRILKPLNKN